MLAELLILLAVGQFELDPRADIGQARAVRIWATDGIIDAGSETAHSVAGHDMLFSRAVEESIAAEVGTKPPKRFRDWIDDFGCDCFEARKMTLEHVVAACRQQPGEARWLYWGLHHPDIEVRLWSNVALRLLSQCRECRGTGNCQYRERKNDEADEPQHWCTRCGCTIDSHRDGGEWRSTCRACLGSGLDWTEGVR